MPANAFGLSPTLLQEIIDLAKSHGLSKMILFASRARSDIDLAVSGGETAAFTLAAQEDAATCSSSTS